jgi:hypothetical protein
LSVMSCGVRSTITSAYTYKKKMLIKMLAFWTREDRQPTSEFIAACPYPDGLMQDGTQAGG